MAERTYWLTVRLTPEERAAIEDAARMDERTASDWARRALRAAIAAAGKGAAAGAVAILLHLPHGAGFGYWQHNPHAPAGPCAVQPGGKPPAPMCWGGFPPPAGGARLLAEELRRG